MKIGIIKEGKNPPDSRTPMTPDDCLVIQEKFPNIKVKVQSSPVRCFKDEEYEKLGIQVEETVADCDILFGVKEVPVSQLLPGKTYFIFSHTKKAQDYNRDLMRALIKYNNTLIDYEALVDDHNNRIIGFGYFAGIVGAHNALRTYGLKYKNYQLKPAYECSGYIEMTKQYKHISVPNIKIAITGSGRVARGAWDVMYKANIKEVSVHEYLNNEFDTPVWVRLLPKALYRHKQTNTYDREDFHNNHQNYNCKFDQFVPQTDVLINGIYWDEHMDRLFELSDVSKPDFRISVIADVTCDINGSVPVNFESTSIKDPVYGVRKANLERTAPYLPDDCIIDVMAVDNLPNELPRDASVYFGDRLIEMVIPELLLPDSEVIKKATICKDGLLGPYFEYLQEYAFGS